MARQKSPSQATKLLEEAKALGDVKKLEDEDCNRDEILFRLELLCSGFANDSWQELTGLTEKRKVSAATNRIRKLAEEIEQLNRHMLVWFLANYVLTGKVEFYRIPVLLRNYAQTLDDAGKLYGPLKHPFQNGVIAFLVAYVKDKTGKFHDKEVSGLIAAVLRSDRYSQKDQQMWRRNHAKLLQLVLGGRRAKDCDFPPSPA